MQETRGGTLRGVVSTLVACVVFGALLCLLEVLPGARRVCSQFGLGLPVGAGVIAGLLALQSVARSRGSASSSERVMLAIRDLRWTRNDFCRGWYISGATGSGKTEALKVLMHLVCRGEADWGGLFIDEKGFFADEVIPILQHYGRGGDLCELTTRPENAGPEWVAPFRFNILGDERVRTSQYVEAILLVAEAVASGKEDKGFFRTQAGLHIGAAIDLFRGVREWQRLCGQPPEQWVAPTLRGVYQILTSEDDFQTLLRDRVGLLVRAGATVPPPPIGEAPATAGCGEAPRPDRPGHAEEHEGPLFPDFRGVEPRLLVSALEHFAKRYWGTRAQEQLEGVKGTITNYLRWFTDDAIHHVFGAESDSFTLNAMDRGRVLCVSLPQRYAIERRYLCALLKVLAYAHARARQPTRSNYNLLIIWQDEAQRFLMPIDGDVDVLRQYQATTVIATQFRGQLEKALGGREAAAPVIGNLRNRIILQAADEDCAEESAKFIGKGLRRKRTVTRQQDGKRSTSLTEEVAYQVEPYQLRRLPCFTAVFCHASGRVRPLRFTPVAADGTVPGWFRGVFALRLRQRLRRWGGRDGRGPFFCAYTPPRRYLK